MPEWAAVKMLALEEGAEEVAKGFNQESGCMLACELPLRYGILCKHWMYPAMIRKCQLPLSLFHPRWLLDGPATVDSWQMSWGDISYETKSEDSRIKQGTEQLKNREEAKNKFTSRDMFHDQGEEMIKDAALTSVHLLRDLPAGEAENFAVAL